MANIDDKLVEMADYVESITGLPTLKAKRSFVPQMNGSFLTIGWNNLEPITKDRVDWPDQNDNTDKLTERVRGLIRASFLIQCFGRGSVQVIKRLRMSMYTSNFRYWADQHEFGFSGDVDVQDISATLLDSNYEERGQLTVAFYITSPEEFDVGYFNKLNGTVEANGETFGEFVTPKEAE